jgi:hypothetical protein
VVWLQVFAAEDFAVDNCSGGVPTAEARLMALPLRASRWMLTLI